ncbi:MAG: ribbon-helix-helix protein, CopG family [Pseudomonadota bacterium]
MSKTAVVTARIDAELAERLDQLAQDLDRSRGSLAARAIAQFVEEEAALVAAIREAEADIAAGNVHTQDEVEAMFGVDRSRRDAA